MLSHCHRGCTVVQANDHERGFHVFISCRPLTRKCTRGATEGAWVWTASSICFQLVSAVPASREVGFMRRDCGISRWAGVFWPAGRLDRDMPVLKGSEARMPNTNVCGFCMEKVWLLF